MQSRQSDSDASAPETSQVRAEMTLEDPTVLLALAGPSHRNLRRLEQLSGVQLGLRGTTILLSGSPRPLAVVQQLLTEASSVLSSGLQLSEQDFVRGFRMLQRDPNSSFSAIYKQRSIATPSQRAITPKTENQRAYVHAILSHDLTFAIGPAGTGKTYLAMALAVQALTQKQVKRIILARPAVEAGERLGFLPGDLAEKVNPYLRPLYDALHDMMPIDRANGLIADGHIEVAPLAFMRGRTLNDCFVILDEAQNTTSDQMKMFLTRLGHSSKAVVTGDITQIDLPDEKNSGLSEAYRILRGIEGIAFCTFTEEDVVRHPLVQKIIRAYERHHRPPVRIHMDEQTAERGSEERKRSEGEETEAGENDE